MSSIACLTLIVAYLIVQEKVPIMTVKNYHLSGWMTVVLTVIIVGEKLVF